MEERFDFYDENFINILKAESQFFQNNNIEDIAGALLRFYVILFKNYIAGRIDKIDVYEDFLKELKNLENHSSFIEPFLYYILEDSVEKATHLINYQKGKIIIEDYWAKKDIDEYIDIASKYGADINLYIKMLNVLGDAEKLNNIIVLNDIPVFNLALNPIIECSFCSADVIQNICEANIFYGYQKNCVILSVDSKALLDEDEYSYDEEDYDDEEYMDYSKAIVFVSLSALDASAKLVDYYNVTGRPLWFKFPGEEQYNDIKPQYRIAMFYDMLEVLHKYKS